MWKAHLLVRAISILTGSLVQVLHQGQALTHGLLQLVLPVRGVMDRLAVVLEGCGVKPDLLALVLTCPSRDAAPEVLG